MAPAGNGDLRAILSTTLVLVDHFGDPERHGAMLTQLKRALELAIGELDGGVPGLPANSLRGLKTKGPYVRS
jgi:hypothetical protein